jgi:hypothetical protein
MKLLFGNLPDEELGFFTKSLEEARGLLAPLLLQRYPYVGTSTWLDGEGDAALDSSGPR